MLVFTLDFETSSTSLALAPQFLSALLNLSDERTRESPHHYSRRKTAECIDALIQGGA